MTRQTISDLLKISTWFCVIAVLFLSGCTVFMPQTQLRKPVQEHLGRELSLETEVDVRTEVYGFFKVCSVCGLDPLMAVLAFPVLGCSKLSCGKDKEWKTDKPCTCRISLATNSEFVLNHELNHCKGYGEI